MVFPIHFHDFPLNISHKCPIIFPELFHKHLINVPFECPRSHVPSHTPINVTWFSPWFSMVFPSFSMISHHFPWFSHEISHQMSIFPSFSHHFPIIFPWFPRPKRRVPPAPVASDARPSARRCPRRGTPQRCWAAAGPAPRGPRPTWDAPRNRGTIGLVFGLVNV